MTVVSAIFVGGGDPDALWDDRYRRIYFGAEFCQRLLPTTEAVKKIIKFAQGKDVGLTFVIPYFTDETIDRIRGILDQLSEIAVGGEAEAVFSSWGALSLIRRTKLSPVMGRLLLKQAKDPRAKHLDENLQRHMRVPSVNRGLWKLLAENGVSRIELDNVLHGLPGETSWLPDGMKASLHFPYGYIATTRLCRFPPRVDPGREIFRVPACEKECIGRIRTLEHPKMPTRLYLSGNTLFFKNERMPEDQELEGIDRIVVQPSINPS